MMNDDAVSRQPMRLAALAGILFLTALSLWLYANRVVPASIGIIGLAIIWISLLPGFHYMAVRQSPPVPILPVTGMFYAIFFGLPVFTIPLAWKDAGSIVLYTRTSLGEINAESLLVVLLGVTIFFTAFALGRRFLTGWIPRFRLPGALDQDHQAVLLWILLTAYTIFILTPWLKNVPSIGMFLHPSGLVALGGIFLLWIRNKLNLLEKFIYLAIIALEIYFRIRLLFLTDLLIFFLFISFIMWREKFFRLFAGMAITIVFVLSLYGASTSIRSSADTGLGNLKNLSVAYVVQMIKGETELKRTKTDSNFFTGRFGSLAERTGQLWVFHHVDQNTPDPVPQWNGKSYAPLLTSYIPRVLYPDKPRETVGGTFGKAYGLIPPSDTTASINLPWITELAVNFGRLGVVIGMAIFGLFLAVLDKLFNTAASDLEFVIGLTLIYPLAYPESNFSVMVGSILPLFVSLVLYFSVGLLISGKLRAPRANA